MLTSCPHSTRHVHVVTHRQRQTRSAGGFLTSSPNRLDDTTHLGCGVVSPAEWNVWQDQLFTAGASKEPKRLAPSTRRYVTCRGELSSPFPPPRPRIQSDGCYQWPAKCISDLLYPLPRKSACGDVMPCITNVNTRQQLYFLGPISVEEPTSSEDLNWAAKQENSMLFHNIRGKGREGGVFCVGEGEKPTSQSTKGPHTSFSCVTVHQWIVGSQGLTSCRWRQDVQVWTLTCNLRSVGETSTYCAPRGQSSRADVTSSPTAVISWQM